MLQGCHVLEVPCMGAQAWNHALRYKSNSPTLQKDVATFNEPVFPRPFLSSRNNDAAGFC